MDTIITFCGKLYKGNVDTPYSAFVFDIKTGVFVGLIDWNLKTVFVSDCFPSTTHEDYLMLNSSKAFIAKIGLIRTAKSIGYRVV